MHLVNFNNFLKCYYFFMNFNKIFFISILIIFGFLFSNTLKAEAATLYFVGGVDTNWNTLGNWYQDASFTIPAASLPTASDDVVSYGFIVSNSGPAATINTLIQETAYIAIPVTVSNGATFNNGAQNQTTGVINGDVQFNGEANNVGQINGNVVFNDNSANINSFGNLTGTVTGNASFYSLSRNGGTINGDACFASTASNGGTVSGSTTVCSTTAPSVETLDPVFAYDIYSIFRGQVASTGGSPITDGGFEYGLNTSYGSTITIDASFDTDSIFTGSHIDLLCNTTYHYRAYARNSNGTSYGADKSFSFSSCTSTAESLLFGIDGAGGNPDPAHLFLLDKDTGLKISDIGAVGFGVTGMDFHPTTGVLYGSTGGASVSPKSLITISTTTGVGTRLGTFKNNSNQIISFPDITFRSDGRLYGFGGSDLYTIDITSCNGSSDTDCLVTKVATSGLSPYGGNGLAFDSNDNLYFVGNGENGYWQINPDTGLPGTEITINNPSSINGTLAAASFDKNDELYLSRLDFGDPEASLSTLNLTSNLLNTSDFINPDMRYMDAIAFDFHGPPPLNSPNVTPAPQVETRRHRSGGGIAIVKPPVIGTDASGSPIVITDELTVLQNRINELLAQIKTLQSGEPLSQIILSNLPNLTLGSQGEGVKFLQIFLINQNLGSASQTLRNTGTTGYFGILTRNALAEYQKVKGINPPLGFFGPLTRAYLKFKGF